jgi:hypothetical protein
MGVCALVKPAAMGYTYVSERAALLSLYADVIAFLNQAVARVEAALYRVVSGLEGPAQGAPRTWC